MLESRSTRTPERGTPRPPSREWIPLLLGAGAALAIGAGSFLNGYYELSKWGPLSIAVLVLLMVMLLTRRSLPPLWTLLPALGLGLLGVVDFVSATWAESVGRAFLEGHRMVFYAALAALLAGIAQRRAGREGLMLGVGLAGLVLAAYASARLLAGDISDIFLRGRLDEPVGYQNAMAAALLLSAWPLVGFAEAIRSRVASGLAAAGASYLILLAVLSQSRGATLALIGAAVLTVVLLPGGGTRCCLLAMFGIGAGVAWPSLDAVSTSQSPTTGIPTTDATAHAVVVAAAVAVVTGATWPLVRPLFGSASVRWRRAAPRRRGLMRGGAIACVVVALGAVGPALLDRLDRSWQQFTRLEPIQDQSRLVSGGGNRYDLWRVAIDQFASAPLGGVGAGNYYKTYFVERRSSEDVRQAHSIELQVAGETGLLGLVALAIFVLGIAVALVRARPVARKTGIERALLVGATGTTLYWLLHTSVDWMHLLPSITGMALAGIAVIGGAAAWPPPTISRRNPWTPLVFAAAILAVAGLGVSLMADRYRGEARELLSDRPQQAAARAEDAIQLDSSSIEGYVILAAAQARENRYAEARATLLAATRREPSNFVPWTLLGDLATRRGERADARAFYRRALALNPRDPSLKGLVR
jgi:hypothetical protein